jgi:hypothetical protein
MKRTQQLVLLTGVLLMFLGSCAKQEGTLVGKWQGTKGNESISFQKDGTFSGILIWDMTKNPIPVSGAYTVEGDTLTLRPDRKTHDLAPMSCKIAYSDSGKELTITFVQGGAVKLDGSIARYRKVT